MAERDWAISADKLSLTFNAGPIWDRHQYQVLKQISFAVKKGETFGVMGRNGCGKSSLLRILAGVIKQSSGSLRFNNIGSRSLLALGLGFNNDLSGRDNALLSLMLQGEEKAEAKEMLEDIQDFSGLGEHFELPVRTYSSGMRSRLGFAVGVTANTDLLLIDETLSVGDQHFKDKAEQVMLEKLNGEQTVIFVSHNSQQVNKLCEHAIWIEQGVIQAGGEAKIVAKEYQRFMRDIK